MSQENVELVRRGFRAFQQRHRSRVSRGPSQGDWSRDRPAGFRDGQGSGELLDQKRR
jgi:hypothetical protein